MSGFWQGWRRMKAVECALLIAASASGFASGHQPRPVQWQSCAVPGIGMARCGTVNVLESPGDPSGRRLALRVIVVAATSATPRPDPVLFLAGGPGQGAAELAAPLAARMAFLREERDLVLVDQRGTGASHPLTCGAPSRAADLMGRLFDPVHLRTCREQLARHADLRRYTTEAAAADYEAVIDALNYLQVNVWGVSYGTRLGLELVRRMPHRVRTLTLEAVVPTSFAWPTSGARDLDAALEAVISDCEGDRDCAAQHRTFRRDVDRAFAALARRAITTTILDPRTRQAERVTFSATDLAYATRGLLYGAEALALPRLFRAAASNQFDAFAQAYINRARGIGQELATGVHLGVYCAEDLPEVDVDAARQLAANTRIGTYLVDQYASACSTWPRASLSNRFHTPVHSKVPTLLMTGRRDPVTPPRTAHDVAKTLTRARVLTWPSGGHGFDGLANPSCKRSIVRQFVMSASVDALRVGCVTQDPKLPFAAADAPSRSQFAATR